MTHLYQMAMDPTFEPMFSTRQTPLRLEVVDTQKDVADTCMSVPPNYSEVIINYNSRYSFYI